MKSSCLMMIQKSCPYCQQAFRLMEELQQENPVYKQISFQVVDELENPSFADSLDYWYVPTYFINGKKIHEGVPTREKIRAVFEEILHIQNEE